LLTNALKFSKAKDIIRVEANLETLSGNEVELSLKVVDTGIGISEEDLT